MNPYTYKEGVLKKCREIFEKNETVDQCISTLSDLIWSWPIIATQNGDPFVFKIVAGDCDSVDTIGLLAFEEEYKK